MYGQDKKKWYTWKCFQIVAYLQNIHLGTSLLYGCALHSQFDIYSTYNIINI